MLPSRSQCGRGFLRRFLIAQVWAFLLFLPALAPLSEAGNRYILFWSPASAPVHLVCVMAVGGVLQLLAALLRKLSPNAYPRAVVVVTGLLLAGEARNTWEALASRSGAMSMVYGASLVVGAIAVVLAAWRWRWTAAGTTVWVERASLFMSTLLAVYWINLFAAPTFDLKPRTLGANPPKLSATIEAPAGDVYVFILDAWSYRLTYDGDEVSSYLPHLKAAASGMCSFSDAHAPGCHTINSLPRFLFQRQGDFSLRGNDVGFWTGDFEPLSQLRSIFHRPREEGFRTCMVGWYHPYEILLGDSADMVVSSNAFRWRGEEPCEIGLQFYQGAARDLLERSLLRGMSTEAMSRKNHAFVRNMETVISHVRKTIDDPGPSVFAVFHLPVPHYPFCYSGEGVRPLGNKYPLDSIEFAREQLIYTDRLVGELIDRIRQRGKYERATIVLTSDHTWREDPELPAGSAHHWSHVPLLIKFPGQQEQLKIDVPFTTSRLERLLQVARSEQYELARVRKILSEESFHVTISDKEADPTKVRPLLK